MKATVTVFSPSMRAYIFGSADRRQDTILHDRLNPLTVASSFRVSRRCARWGPGTSQINAAHRWSNRRCGFRLCPLSGAYVKRGAVSARKVERLRGLAAELQDDRVQVATDLSNSPQRPTSDLRGESGVPALLLGRIAPDAIVCDAGYPKNLSPTARFA